MIAKGDRIEELEEALKESVRITAEREMVMVEQQQQLEEAEQKVSRAKVKAKISPVLKFWNKKNNQFKRL